MTIDSFNDWLRQQPLPSGEYVGLDVGGANLKCVWLSLCQSHVELKWHVRRTISVPFPLWKEPENLPRALSALLESCPRQTKISVTMTGEIADCFSTKLEGVQAIVAACEQACVERGFNVAYYAQATTSRHTPGTPDDHQAYQPIFCSAKEAIEDHLRVAASNWHAVATLFGYHLTTVEKSSGLLLDLGSTTFDLTPVFAGPTAVSPATDWERIKAGQLIYSGVGRSPLACLVPELELDHGRTISLAQELFATARDAYLLTGDEPELPACCNTADGRPATKPFARQRIARMLCSDAAELPTGLLENIAAVAKANQMSNIRAAIVRQIQSIRHCGWICVCGQGEKLLAEVVADSQPEVRCLRLSEWKGHGCSLAAPAFATALARAFSGR